MSVRDSSNESARGVLTNGRALREAIQLELDSLHQASFHGYAWVAACGTVLWKFLDSLTADTSWETVFRFFIAAQMFFYIFPLIGISAWPWTRPKTQSIHQTRAERQFRGAAIIWIWLTYGSLNIGNTLRIWQMAGLWPLAVPSLATVASMPTLARKLGPFFRAPTPSLAIRALRGGLAFSISIVSTGAALWLIYSIREMLPKGKWASPDLRTAILATLTEALFVLAPVGLLELRSRSHLLALRRDLLLGRITEFVAAQEFDAEFPERRRRYFGDEDDDDDNTDVDV